MIHLLNTLPTNVIGISFLTYFLIILARFPEVIGNFRNVAAAALFIPLFMEIWLLNRMIS